MKKIKQGFVVESDWEAALASVASESLSEEITTELRPQWKVKQQSQGEKHSKQEKTASTDVL